MTCIIGLIKNKKVYIGGDSAGVGGLDIIIRRDSKVFKTGKFIMGYTSSFRMGQLLRFKLKVKDQTEKQDDFEYMCTTFIDTVRKCLKDNGYTTIDNNVEEIGHFLVGYNNHLYYIGGNLQVGESYESFESVGCGENYAKGAMEVLIKSKQSPKTIINKALTIVTKFSAGVRPPFNIVEI